MSKKTRSSELPPPKVIKANKNEIVSNNKLKLILSSRTGLIKC